MSGESKDISNSEELLHEEAIRELDEILSENLEMYYDYENIKRYYAAGIRTLEIINEEIREAGGIQSVCTYFNPDVHPPSAIYQDRYPTTKYGDHREVKQLIKDIKSDMPDLENVDYFFNDVCEKLWEKEPILNNHNNGDNTQEQMNYVESFLQDFENITENMSFNMDSTNTLKNAYNKWQRKCEIIKSHTLKVTKKGIWDSMLDFYSNFLFECRYQLGMRGGYKKKKRKSRKRKSRRRRRKTKKSKTRHRRRRR